MTTPCCPLGAVTGDVIGSRFERYRVTDPGFPLFTEGSRLTYPLLRLDSYHLPEAERHQIQVWEIEFMR